MFLNKYLSQLTAKGKVTKIFRCLVQDWHIGCGQQRELSWFLAQPQHLALNVKTKFHKKKKKYKIDELMMKCNEATTTVAILHLAEMFETVLQMCDVANAENTAFMLLVWAFIVFFESDKKPEPKNKTSVIFSFSPCSGFSSCQKVRLCRSACAHGHSGFHFQVFKGDFWGLAFV